MEAKQEKKSLGSKLIDAGKFILDLADDVIIGIKHLLPVAEKALHGILGSTFGVLCFYLSYDAYTAWKKDLKSQEYRHYETWKADCPDAETPAEHQKILRRILRNNLILKLSIAASSLAILLIIGAFIALPGLAIFPFVITSTLMLSALIHSVDLYLCLKDPFISELEKYGKDKKSGTQREFKYKLIDAVAFVVIVLGLGLATFTSLASIALFPHFTLPLLFIVVGATIGVVAKFFEHAGPHDEHADGEVPAEGAEHNKGSGSDSDLDSGETPSASSVANSTLTTGGSSGGSLTIDISQGNGDSQTRSEPSTSGSQGEHSRQSSDSFIDTSPVPKNLHKRQNSRPDIFYERAQQAAAQAKHQPGNVVVKKDSTDVVTNEM